MNIDDITNAEAIPDEEVFPRIFKMQVELARKYGPIETKNGFYHPNIDQPPHIDSAKYQNWIKDMFWRTTEEIAEALEPIHEAFPKRLDWRTQWETNADLRHVYEEFADALHFLVEVSATLGFDSTILTTRWSVTDYEGLAPTQWITRIAGSFIFNLGLAANCLKNKPWKSTHMATDQVKFKQCLENSWEKFIWLLKGLDLTLQDVYNLYCKKNAVNDFRQRSNY